VSSRAYVVSPAQLRTKANDRVTIDHCRKTFSIGVSAAVVGCAVALGAVGCGDDDTPLRADNLEHFGVAKSDLPAGYKRVRHKSSPSVGTCIQNVGPEVARLAAVSCDSTSYAKSGDTLTNTLAASVVLLKSEREAARVMRELRKPRQSNIHRTGDGASDITVGTPHSLAVSELGDEAPRGIVVRAGLPAFGSFDVLYYCWRRGKVAACAGSSTALGDFDAASTLKLARTIDRRIAGGLS